MALAGLLLFGILLTLPYSGSGVDWNSDGLYYEAHKREIQGESAEAARREVFSSGLATGLKREEAGLPPRLRRIDNPEWVEYSARFYRRRWTVPLLAAGLDPVFGDRALEQVSLIALALLPALLYLLLRRRFGEGLSVGASVFTCVLPPVLQVADSPLTDSWGIALLAAGVLVAMLIRDSGLRWLPAWIAVVVALSFTRDLTIVLVVAAGWVALRERSGPMAIAAVSAVIASLPAPLVFATPLRENFAYVFDQYRIPEDTTWHSILGDYPSELLHLIGSDLGYPGVSPVPIVVTLALGVVALAGLAALVFPWKHSDPFLSLIRAAALGGLATILVSVNYTDLRLELVFVPAIATGVALLGERLLRRLQGERRDSPAHSG